MAASVEIDRIRMLLGPEKGRNGRKTHLHTGMGDGRSARASNSGRI
jgi:hypothetical protein